MKKSRRLCVATLYVGLVSSFSSSNVSIRQKKIKIGKLATVSEDDLPYFATTLKQPLSEGTASVTSRVPLGTIFDSRDFIFSTATNVRSYEWSLKEAEELLDDLTEASKGNFGESSNYELNQIILVPMEWNRDLFGLGSKYDLYDGQQRIVTLCLIIAALRAAFSDDGDMGDTVTELNNMLNPPKVRKADVLRVELNKRDNTVLSHILRNELDELDHLNFKRMSEANQNIYKNYMGFLSKVSTMIKDDRLKLLDYMIENVYLLACVPESSAIARSMVISQGKGKNNEVIDDFKGLVCFRYNKIEKDMYETFDLFDRLTSIHDIDNRSVGRGIVFDSCLLQASAQLKSKIRKRDQIHFLECWLRQDLIINEYEGLQFFRQKIEPASICLSRFRTGKFKSFELYANNKEDKVLENLLMRLHFLRDLITSIPSTKEIELVVLELLLRVELVNDNMMRLSELESSLHEVEKLAMWMALTKPPAAKRYEKCFKYLDAVDSGIIESSMMSQEDISSLREALVITEFGATSAGRKFATALLRRLNFYIILENTDKCDIDEIAATFLEAVLPGKTTKKAWANEWPDQDERDKWLHRLGNLALLSKKATVKESRMPFVEKQNRFAKEIWPITAGLNEVDIWNSDNLVKHLARTVALIDTVWSL